MSLVVITFRGRITGTRAEVIEIDRPLLALRRHRVDRDLHPRLPDPVLRPSRPAPPRSDHEQSAVEAPASMLRRRRAEHSTRLDLLYLKVAAALFVLTGMEVYASYAEWLGGAFLPLLLILMAIKFVLVVLFFMHLKFDAKIFGRLFWAGFLPGRRRLRRRPGDLPVLRQAYRSGGGRRAGRGIDPNVWKFQPHPEVWLLVAFLVGAYIYAIRVIGPRAVRPGQPVVRGTQVVCFVAGHRPAVGGLGLADPRRRREQPLRRPHAAAHDPGVLRAAAAAAGDAGVAGPPAGRRRPRLRRRSAGSPSRSWPA